LRPAKYTYNDIIKLATSFYRTALDRKMWTLAQSGKNSGEIPVSMKAEVTSLIQSAVDKQLKNNKNSGGGKESGVKCWDCGGNHYARNCPKKDGNSNNNGNNGGQNQQHGNQGNSGGSGKRKWKSIPPKEGESEQKTHEGKTYYWCAKCRKWNLTHKTDQHMAGIGKEGQGGQAKKDGDGAANMAAASYPGLVAGFLSKIPKE